MLILFYIHIKERLSWDGSDVRGAGIGLVLRCFGIWENIDENDKGRNKSIGRDFSIPKS